MSAAARFVYTACPTSDNPQTARMPWLSGHSTRRSPPLRSGPGMNSFEWRRKVATHSWTASSRCRSTHATPPLGPRNRAERGGGLPSTPPCAAGVESQLEVPGGSPGDPAAPITVGMSAQCDPRMCWASHAATQPERGVPLLRQYLKPLQTGKMLRDATDGEVRPPLPEASVLIRIPLRHPPTKADEHVQVEGKGPPVACLFQR